MLNNIRNDLKFLTKKYKKPIDSNVINSYGLTKTEHLMNFVHKKISHLQGINKRDLISLIFGAGNLIFSLDNRREINIIKKKQLDNENKLNSLIHTIEHQTDILKRYTNRVERIYSKLEKNFNIMKFKLYESETLIFLNNIYTYLYTTTNPIDELCDIEIIGTNSNIASIVTPTKALILLFREKIPLSVTQNTAQAYQSSLSSSFS